MAVNRGVDSETNEPDYGEWFDHNFVEGLARLAREDEEWLQAKTTSAHDKAVARRAIIFCIDDYMYENGQSSASDNARSRMSADHVKRGTPKPLRKP